MDLVKVENLSVKYESARFAGTLLSQADDLQSDSSWELEPVSFNIQKGQGLGLVGVNGSGKSSLLKAILGIIPPATGTIQTPESTLGVFDLNLFFHPDFSGYENLFMMNACHGKADHELEGKMEFIEEFSQIHEYLHRPIREYSAGMRMRLGIAYILLQDFDFLAIDEVLAVGDLAFQRKCVAFLRDKLKAGKSLLVASHNLDEIATLCQDILLLDKGKILMYGPVEEVLCAYMRHAEELGLNAKALMNHHGFTPPEPLREKIMISGVRFLNSEGMEVSRFHTGESISVEVTVKIEDGAVHNPLFRMEIFRNDNLLVCATNNYRHDAFFDLPEGEATVCIEIDSLNLLTGLYYVAISIWPDEYTSLVTGEAYDVHDRRYEISVHSHRTQGAGICGLPGKIRLKTEEED